MYQGYKPYSVLFSLKQLFGENADKSDANSLKVNDTICRKSLSHFKGAQAWDIRIQGFLHKSDLYEVTYHSFVFKLLSNKDGLIINFVNFHTYKLWRNTVLARRPSMTKG